MKNPEASVADAASSVGILLLSHGPLADALRETVQVLEPVETAGMTAADLPRLKSLVRDRIAAGRAGRSTAAVAPRPAATPEGLAMGDPAAPRP